MKIIFALLISTFAFNVHAESKKSMKPTPRTIASAEQYECAGTEPFWSASFKGDKVVFSSPDIASAMEKTNKEEWRISQKLHPIGVQESFGFVVKAANKKSSVTAFVRSGECNDGMSEIKYSHELIFVNGSSVYAGCCNKK